MPDDLFMQFVAETDMPEDPFTLGAETLTDEEGLPVLFHSEESGRE